MPFTDILVDRAWVIINLADFLEKAEVEQFINSSRVAAAFFLPVLRFLRSVTLEVQSRTIQASAKGQC